ncbi:MAG TPA: hypothetical protein VK369_10390 [Segetibacter sp.]|jgi:hypothetical protein|nr:hypothetical protein [Segetibacter sp.]
MYINFNYHGSTYKAGLAKQPEGKIIVLLNDNDLGKQFGSTLPFYVENKSVNFNILNRSHSELYALNSSISKAISEQCKDLLA